jgi:MFS family permease
LSHTAPIAIGLAIVLIFMMHAGQAVGGPAWVTWMADLVPERTRGKYFARRRQWGIATAIPAALVTGWLLDRHASTGDPLLTLRWCALIFMGAAVFGFMDIHVFQYVPDVPKPPQRGQHLLRALHEPLRNRQFLWFAGFVAMITFAVSFMGQFVTLYVIDKVGVNGIGTQMMLLVAPMAVQLLVLPAWGKAADRMGKKPLLAIASLGLVPVGLGWCLLGPHNVWLGYVLSILGSALWTGIEVANFNLVLELSGSDDDPNGNTGGTSYVAVNSIIINIAGCLGGLASGVIAQSLRNWHWDIGIIGMTTIGFYEVPFILSGVLRLLAAVIFLPFLHEPEARPTHEALRFMTSNIYNNLFNAILQPLRFVGLAKTDVDG